MFRLTQDERLDGHTDCTLWTPFAKMHVVGQLFISNNYICFNSREEDLCQLIIPLREVNKLLMNPCQFSESTVGSSWGIGQWSVFNDAIHHNYKATSRI